ncbi:MAG: hypothetical protein ABJO65_19770, partial [Hyphomicrobiales bacterium]
EGQTAEVIDTAIALEKCKGLSELANPQIGAMITTESIPFPNYGGGAKYSIFENAYACAVWLKDQIAQTS